MKLKTVALVGRPNVGKSTLFNKLAHAKISIIEDTPGVTRDRIYSEVSYLDYKFNLIDTENKRSIVVVKKVNDTPKQYPRKAGKPAKEPIR